MSRKALLWSLAMTWVLHCAPASGEEGDFVAQARWHLRKASELIAKKEYRPAIQEMKEAYALDPDSTILYNIGMAYRDVSDGKNVSDMQRAAEHLEQYLERRHDAPDKDDVEQIIAQLKIDSYQITHQAEVDDYKRVIRLKEAADEKHRGKVIASTLNSIGAAVTLLGVSLLAYASTAYDTSYRAATLEEYNQQWSGARGFMISGGVLIGAGAVVLAAGVTSLVRYLQKERATDEKAPTSGAIGWNDFTLRGAF
jgi:hypothetical protein